MNFLQIDEIVHNTASITQYKIHRPHVSRIVVSQGSVLPSQGIEIKEDREDKATDDILYKR